MAAPSTGPAKGRMESGVTVLVRTLESDLGSRLAAANAAGVNPGTLGRWKTGRFRPSPSHLEALAVASGRTLKSLLAATGVSASEIITASGLNAGTVWRWGRGDFAPTADSLAALAGAASLTVGEVAALVAASVRVVNAVQVSETQVGFPEPKVRSDKPMLGGYAAKQCPTMASKDNDPNYPDELKDDWSPFMLSLFDSGNEFETEVGQAFIDAYETSFTLDTTNITSQDEAAALVAEARKYELVILEGTRDALSKAAREWVTHRLMERPGRIMVLWNARLERWRNLDEVTGEAEWSQMVCEPDFLWLHGYEDGQYRWGPGDVKWHKPFAGESKDLEWSASRLGEMHPTWGEEIVNDGRPQLSDAMQLAHYWRALEFHGFAPTCDPIGAIIGKAYTDKLGVFDNELVGVWVPLAAPMYDRGHASALELYDAKFAKVYKVVERARARGLNPELPSLAPPEWKSDCSECQWKTNCHEELAAADHITLLAGVTPDRAKPLYDIDVHSVESLANLDAATAALLDAKAEYLDEIIVEAQAGVFDGFTAEEIMVRHYGHLKCIDGILDAAEQFEIRTVEDIANLDVRTAERGVRGGKLLDQIDQARVTDFARVRKLQHIFRTRGTDRIDIPRAPVEIHVDMENDAHIYMWGCFTEERSGRNLSQTHTPFVDWSKTDDGEAQCFADFWKWLRDQQAAAHAKYGEHGFKAYYYTAAENRCMRHLAKAHVGKPGIPTLDEVEAFIASDDWVDLYPLLTSQLVWPTETMSLKSLAKYARFMWRDEDPSGSASVTWYRKAVDDPDDKVRETYRTRILDYNEDDVRATAHLLNWVTRFNEVANFEKKLPSVASLDARYSPAKKQPRRKVS